MIILKILKQKNPLDKKSLQEEFEKYGLGGTAFNTSMETCYELNLVICKKERLHVRGTISHMHSLTEKGKKIAEHLVEIEKILEL